MPQINHSYKFRGKNKKYDLAWHGIINHFNYFQSKFEKTATLMRHHHRSHDFKRQNLAIILDPFNTGCPPASSVSSASNPNYIDHQNMNGLNDAIAANQDEPIFVPHHEKVN